MKKMLTQKVTDRLVEFVNDLEYKDIPPDAVHEAKRFLLDSIGCALGGLSVDKGKFAVKMARHLGGPPESSIWGLGDRVSPASAAFANGELINALDMDGIMFPGGHVPPCVIPAPLALAEYRGSCGKELIMDIAMVLELSTRVSAGFKAWREFTSEGHEKGKIKWPEVSGLSIPIIAAALACGKLLRLDKDKLAHAVGIAVHFCPVPSTSKWEKTVPSAMSKYLAMGWVSQAEVQAALLAEMGYMGDTTILEGPYGFWRMYGSDRWEPEKIVDKLGERWLLPRRAIYKPYPCCRGMHGGLDCFIYLLEKHNLQPDEIEKVWCGTDPIVDLPLWKNRTLFSHVDAQFIDAYGFAAAAYRLPPGPIWQSKEALENPKILSFMDKVTVETHPRYGDLILEDPRSPISKVEVVARGQTFVEERRWMKGNPTPEHARMTDEELIVKFKNNASHILPENKLDKAVQAIMEIEKLETTQELTEQIII